MKNNTIKVIAWGLKCDNPECDWRDDTVLFKDYKKWINAPCPKCGQNVLTQHDMNNTKILKKAIDFTNMLNRFFGVKVDHSNDKKVFVNTHNDITFRVEDK